ncbi:MAG: hypothetical protein ACOC0J_00765, partial [Myxococcota bacterium]
MCARELDGDEERCADVPLPSDELVVALNVPPRAEWEVLLWAFDSRGEGVWNGRTTMSSFPGESSRGRILLTRSSDLTPVPCADELRAPPFGMSRPRAFHTVTHLPGGRLLIAGGFSAIRGDATCDPDCSSPDPSADQGFIDQDGLPCLPMCRLLVAEKTAEVFDPILGRVTHTIALARPRGMHTATLTSDGRHLILAGGISSARLYLDGKAPLILPDGFPVTTEGEATAEVLNSFLASREGEVALAGPRFMHDAVDDGLGAVLLIGGMTVEQESIRLAGGDDGVLPRVELVAPEGSGALEVTGAGARRGHRALRMGSKVVVLGGSDVASTDPVPFAETYDLSSAGAEPLGDPEEASPRRRRYSPLGHS